MGTRFLDRFAPVKIAAPALALATLAAGCGEGEAPTSQSSAAVAEPRFAAVQPDLLGAPNTLTNAWADIDRDGDLDLFVGFNGRANRMYRNDGGTLIEVGAELGLAARRRTRTSAWGDYDGDGDPDLFLGLVADSTGPATQLLRNDGGGFTDVTREAGIELTEGATRQASWVDFDGDGDLDLYLGLRDRENVLFLNEGGRFRDVAPEVGVADARRTVGAVWFDYQQDGDLDVVVANMDGGANGLFRNDGGRFTDVAEAAGIADGGRGLGDESHGTVRPCVVDYDADGLLDLFMANYGPNALYRNQGDGTFRNVGQEQGVAIDGRYDACTFGDFDLDGRIDLYVNGTFTGGTQFRDYLFRQTADGFVDVTPPEVLALDADHGAHWVDYDGDGRLDLSLTGARDAGMHHVLRNVAELEAPRSSLQVMVVDGSGSPTRAGAEVRLYRAGTQTLLGLQVVDSGSGYNSQNVMPLHFGLAAADLVDVVVVFPRGGERREVRVNGVDPTTASAGALVMRTGG